MNTIKKFDKERNLCYSWDKFEIDYTHVHTDDISTAKLDHFLWTNGLDKYVLEGISQGTRLFG